MSTTVDDPHSVQAFATSLAARAPKTMTTYRTILRQFVA
jgi:hypothetical protein